MSTLITSHVWRQDPRPRANRVECAFMNCRKTRGEHRRGAIGQAGRGWRR